MMTVTKGFLRSSRELMTPSAIISAAAGSMCVPSATMRLPLLRIFSIPEFTGPHCGTRWRSPQRSMPVTARIRVQIAERFLSNSRPSQAVRKEPVQAATPRRGFSFWDPGISSSIQPDASVDPTRGSCRVPLKSWTAAACFHRLSGFDCNAIALNSSIVVLESVLSRPRHRLTREDWSGHAVAGALRVAARS